MAWNRGDARQATVSVAALDWAINAMTEVTGRLGGDRAPALDLRHAAITVSEATWWVTLVDATLVRYFPGRYDAILDNQPAPERAEIEHTLGGLRYVRNQMGVHLDPDEFLREPAGRDNGARPGPAAAPDVTWTWSSLPEPVTQELTPRGQEWERSRYQDYQDWLAGRAITRAFALAAQFLRMAAASFPPESSLTA